MKKTMIARRDIWKEKVVVFLFFLEEEKKRKDIEYKEKGMFERRKRISQRQ